MLNLPPLPKLFHTNPPPSDSKPAYMAGEKAQSMAAAVGAADPSVLNPFQLAGELVELEAQRKVRKEEFEAAEAKVNEAKAKLIQAFDAHQVDKVSTGGKTIYRWSQWRASISAPNQPEAFEALRAAGVGDLIKETVNAQSLSAWVREQPKAADDTPILPNMELQKTVTMHKTNDLRIVNS